MHARLTLQTLSAGLKAGLLYPLAGSSLFSDRFHLGGPTSVRSFRMNGLGPRDNNDHIGGDLVAAAGMSLLTPIPYKPHWPLKGHVYVNGGSLVGLDKARSLASNIGTLASQPACSAGVGLMFHHSLVRLELNAGVPLSASRTDASRKGIQFGVGLSFLS